MKPKLVEIDFVFRARVPDREAPQLFVVQAGLLHGKLHLSFSIGGPGDERENLPSELIDAISQGLEYAGKTVRVKDLSEIDPEEQNE